MRIFRRVGNLIGRIGSHLKPYLRHFIVAAALCFVVKALWEHWHEVSQIRLGVTNLGVLAIALVVTLFSHVWAAWVWVWILREFHQSVNTAWGISIFLQTNIAKYLPGNIWHFWGRVKAASNVGVPPEIAVLSVLLEPLLMAADGLLMAIVGSPLEHNRGLQVLALVAILAAIHPKILNFIVQFVGKVKLKKASESSLAAFKTREAVEDNSSPENEEKFYNHPIENSHLPRQFRIKRYPLLPLLGEFFFIALRGSGFLLVLAALTPVNLSEVPQLLSAFSLAYVVGLVVPGAPGGVGVFEAIAIALLSYHFSAGIIVSGVAIYRLISILAEVMGAGLAWVSRSVVSSH